MGSRSLFGSNLCYVDVENAPNMMVSSGEKTSSSGVRVNQPLLPASAPLDLNELPASSPETVTLARIEEIKRPEPEPSSSSGLESVKTKIEEVERELKDSREELKVWEERLKGWEAEERQVKDRALQSLLIHKDIQKLGWKTFFSEMRRQGPKRAISERKNRRG